MATKKPAHNIPAEIIALYDALIATLPGAERKGATMPYTSVNGHMFSFLDKEGNLSLRLPAGACDEFIKKYKTALSVQHGAVLKEYIVVPQALFTDTKKLAPYFVQSYQYTSMLKPKATPKLKK